MEVLDGLLQRGREVVVVERDEGNRYLSEVRRRGVPLVLGDATLGPDARCVNLARAASVAILTSDDLTNIETGLAVRDRLGARWEEVPVVLRVFDRQLGRRLEDSFGFRHVWSTVAIAAPWFVGAALGLDVLYSFYVGSHPFLVARLPIAAGGGLEGLAMSQLVSRDPGRRDRSGPETAGRSSTPRGATRDWRPATARTSPAPTRSCSRSCAASTRSADRAAPHRSQIVHGRFTTRTPDGRGRAGDCRVRLSLFGGGTSP